MLQKVNGLKKLTTYKESKKFIYLISPNKIEGGFFYNQLNEIFKLNKVAFFQLRLKNEKKNNKLIIGKKIKKLCKKYKVKFIVNDDPFLAKKVKADGCHLGQKGYKYSFSAKNFKKTYNRNYLPWFKKINYKGYKK